MSDEEEVYSDEEYEEEEEVEEVEEVEQAEVEHEEDTEETEESTDKLNEAEKAMLAAKKRHENEDEAKLQDYEERRRTEREKEEEELKKLKEKQERRRLEREQEEREAAERKRQDEEKRQREEQERRARAEEEKRKKEEEKLKKAQMMGVAAGQGGRNFVIQKKAENAGVGDRFGNIVQAKQEMGMTKEQQEETKSAYMIQIEKNIPEASEILPNDMKAKIKELHQRICKLEAQKYDSEKRHERQSYDLKELNERSRQVARANNAKNGQGPSDDTNGRHPPKVQVFSKYDRQIDRRNFKERRSVYESKNAFPCFPGIAPPPTLYEKVIKKLEYEIQEEADAEEEYEDEEEEE